METSIKTTVVRMLANFEKNIFIPMTGDLEKPDALHEKLKGMGAALGRHSINLLLEGKEKLVRGFEVVTVNDKHIAPAVAMKRSTPELEGVVTRKAGYQPAGTVVPVRRGSQIAIGMELLMKGATLDELQEKLGHANHDAVNNFLMYRPKKRGYGLRKEGDKYFLVLPEGTTGIAYKS